jgi:phosphomevalonate kinase
MGELADVPLEPPEQTQLADATMNVKGCLIAGVPGGSYPPFHLMIAQADPPFFFFFFFFL